MGDPARPDLPPPSRGVQLVLQAGASLVDRVLERLADEMPDYVGRLGQQELRASFTVSFRLVLTMLAERREPLPSELDGLRRLGARRAEAGLELTDATRAYRLGFLVMWEGLVDLSATHAGFVPPHDPADVVRLWWVHDRMVGTMEDGYRHRARQLDEHGGERGRALLEAVRLLPQGPDRTQAAARACGLDLSTPLTVHVGCGESGRTPRLRQGVAVPEDDGRLVVIVPARAPEAEGLPQALGRLGWTAVGTGCVAADVLCARSSLLQAEWACGAAAASGVAALHAESDWFTCLVAAEPTPVTPGLHDLEQVFVDDPSTAETVAAYLVADRNLTHAAARLFVHPNTVAYRLRRLDEVTGLDLRTLDGVLRAAAVLARLGRYPGGPQAGPSACAPPAVPAQGPRGR